MKRYFRKVGLDSTEDGSCVSLSERHPDAVQRSGNFPSLLNKSNVRIRGVLPGVFQFANTYRPWHHDLDPLEV